MWVKVEGEGASTRMVDLSEVERAVKRGDGAVTLYFKSGASPDFSGATAKALWEALEAKVQPSTWKMP